MFVVFVIYFIDDIILILITFYYFISNMFLYCTICAIVTVIY